MEIDFDKSYRIRFEIRHDGRIVQTGETAGKKEWLDNKRFGDMNAIKRVKSALGWKWSVKTDAAKGAGDIVRKLADGGVLHIWIERSAPISGVVGEVSLGFNIGRRVGMFADRVSSGLMTLGDVTSYALETLSEGEFDACDDWRDEVENELAKREIGI